MGCKGLLPFVVLVNLWLSIVDGDDAADNGDLCYDFSEGDDVPDHSASITPFESTTSPTPVSSIASTATSSGVTFQIPTPGLQVPTNTFSGTVLPFTAGTPVAIYNPSFEEISRDGSLSKRAKRQSAFQIALAAEGWTISSCGTENLSDCVFQNYDAVDGTWAFSGRRGGVLYQDGVQLLAGATYNFTFYWKIVSANNNGMDSSFVKEHMDHRVSLGNTYISQHDRYSRQFLYYFASDGFESGGAEDSGPGWALETMGNSRVTCDYVPFASEISPDGSLNYRVFVEGLASQPWPGVDDGIDGADFLWYMDQIRIQATTTSNYLVTQTYDATATPTAGTNLLGNPSFENYTILMIGDIVIDAVRIYEEDRWVENGCTNFWCGIKYAASSVFACQDGITCHYWYPPTQWSQTINVNTGSTYFISIWTFLASVSSSGKTGSSIVNLTMEAPGTAPGSGAVVLSVANSAITLDWVQSTKMLDLDANFVQNVCGSTDDSTTVSCQFTISTGYAGSWDTTDTLPDDPYYPTNIRNYLG
ncbi:hypothetical protein TruAng_005711 [Truncatella angustata]|nr:hypothetical protein TruAng_005711 [Truncatella angustata]